jgi:squalene-associated FAD-dependent desaturase
VAATPPILIVGGGFAGLAAAVDLASAGARVTLLERRPFLGGRAYSFTDRVTGETVDNGQHLLMGCYHETLDFLRRIGASNKLKIQRTPCVDFLDARAGLARLRLPSAPAPLHLLAGLARLGTVSWRDRLGALRVGLALRRMKGTDARLADLTVREWLDELGQSERIQRRFWNLIALATLNELPERAAADLFARVLDEAFLRARGDSAIIIPRVGLSELYTVDARRFIEERGGEVHLSADVAQIEFKGSRAIGVTLRGGERLAGSAIISAVTHTALRRIIPQDAAERWEALRSLDQIGVSPIVSINLWYDEPVTDLEFVGLLDGRIEWVFNRSAIAGRKGRQHLALVISGARTLSEQPKERLIEIAREEIERFFPAARAQRPANALVVREQEATISQTVGTARRRPAQKTPYENFFLAGDWTATGLPATIEGAVWSGRECARALIGTL